jgi:hypothetical protein
LDLVDVGGIDGRGEEAQRHVVAMWWRNGVAVKREYSWRLAIVGECEGFSLFVAVCGYVAALRESR